MDFPGNSKILQRKELVPLRCKRLVLSVGLKSRIDQFDHDKRIRLPSQILRWQVVGSENWNFSPSKKSASTYL